MDKFCGSVFWDLNLTWFNDDPEFTPCFEETVLTWIPCGFLWFSAILIFYNFGSQRSESIPRWTKLGLVKLINTIILIAIQFIHFGMRYFQQKKESLYHETWVTPAILAATFILSLVILIIHQRRRVHTSFTQFFFWILMSLNVSIILRTTIKKYKNDEIELSLIILQGIYTFFIFLQLLLNCWADLSSSSGSYTRLGTDSEEEKQPNPVIEASVLSYILFSWVTPFARQGYRKSVELKDLWSQRPWDKCQNLMPVFLRYWNLRPQKNQSRYESSGSGIEDEVTFQTKTTRRSIFQNIIKPLWKTSGSSFVIGVLMAHLMDLLMFAFPMIQGLIIDFVEDKEQETWKGYFFAILLFLNSLLQTLVIAQFYYHMNTVTMNIQSCLCSAVYRKALTISSVARKDKSTGQIVNLMSTDIEKIRFTVYQADQIIGGPAKLALALYLLWQQLGIAVLSGMAIMVLMIPFNWWTAWLQEKYQDAQMKKKDERIKMMNELLSGMKIVKLYAWETAFENEIEKIREEEIRLLRRLAYLKTFVNLMFDIAPLLVAEATFGTYILIDPNRIITAKKIFVSLSLFNILNQPLTTIPRFLSEVIQAYVSCKRMNDFFNAEDINPNAINYEIEKRSNEDLQNQNIEEMDVIVIEEGSFTWELPGKTLEDLNLSIKKGSFVAVVGQIGSGKSSLLSSILGEMTKLNGSITVRGSIAYLPQIPWIQNATLKDNILFGSNFDQEKYDQVIERCGLGPDLLIFPAGDMTEIGEKGLNLSGGQKSRVALARAVYSEADIYLLDDPLSAVDSHVAKHIFDKLLGPGGLLANKTRVLCTHAYNFLSQVDDIVVLKEGRITEQGSHDVLLSNQKSFASLLREHLQTAETEENEEISAADEKVKKSTTGQEGKLIHQENVEEGQVKASVFIAYMKSIGTISFSVILMLYAAGQVFSVGTNAVLTAWANEPVINGTQDPVQRDIYFGAYSGLVVMKSITSVMGFGMLFILSLSASRRFHDTMLGRVIRAPISFFDTTPLGRILNRFGQDVDTMDNEVSYAFSDLVDTVVKVLSILSVISYTTPVFLAFVLPIAVVYFFLQRFYIATARQLQRLLSILRSPVYSFFSETLNGVVTIRAFKAQDRFVEIIEEKINAYVTCQFPHQVIRRWLSVRLENVGNSIIFVVALAAVIWRNVISSSIVGFALTYALQISDRLSWLVKVVTYVETDFVSVERILEYSKLNMEAPLEIPEHSPAAGWPENGQIILKEYETRYRDELKVVLNRISCTIHPGERIGIVGRTGAGKSSLILGLFRLMEASYGSIVIDGLDISKLGLHDVRKRITVIPQDPVLFSSTLRLNLDPFQDYSDAELWSALTHAHLKSFVDTIPEGLEMKISESGENLSVGQRQLVCLARAILRKTKILVLDEATASVDMKTDELIQSTIRSEFADCTILNVAHRLRTVMDSTRILVLDLGEIREFDTPSNLLANKESVFYGMAQDAGLV